MADKILTDAEAQAEVQAANYRLKAARTGVAMEVRGKKRVLCLRGIFPPKPGDGRSQPYQTRHSLEIKALTRKDIQSAELIAKQVGLDLNTGQFDWRKWSDWEPDALPEGTVGYWFQKLEEQFWAQRGVNPSTRNTWRTNYKPFLKDLPADEQITADLLCRVVYEKSEAGTSKRRSYCVGARALAELAGLEINLKGTSKKQDLAINPRTIPSDEDLLAMRNAIAAPGWQYLFGLQMCYGLRTHEVLLVDFEFPNFPRIRVTRGKTGPRTVLPLLQQWAEEWRLNEPIMPRVVFMPDDPLHLLSQRVIRGYRSQGLPVPYTLRHAYARRALQELTDPSLGAKLMGHSLNVHVKTYRAWIEDSVYLDVVERILRDRGRD